MLFEVPERLADEFASKFKAVAEEPPGPEFKSWKLPVDVKKSRRWKPIKFVCDSKCGEMVALEIESKSDSATNWVGKCKCGKTTRREVLKNLVGGAAA